jgi:hypothetical protein
MISRPDIVVEVIGPADMRTGATIKHAGVAYIDEKKRLTVRAAAEFHRIFRAFNEPTKHTD